MLTIYNALFPVCLTKWDKKIDHFIPTSSISRKTSCNTKTKGETQVFTDYAWYTAVYTVANTVWGLWKERSCCSWKQHYVCSSSSYIVLTWVMEKLLLLLKKRDDVNRLNKIIKKAESTTGTHQDNLESILDKQILKNLNNIETNTSHPLHSICLEHCSAMADIFTSPGCKTQLFRRSFLPYAKTHRFLDSLMMFL